MKKHYSFIRAISSFMLGTMLLGMVAQTASAEQILFQDDTFATVYSNTIEIGSNKAGASNTGIQFGADATASNNGNILWNIGTHRFSADHGVDVTGSVTATNGMSVSGGQVDFHSAAGMRLRESSNPNSLAACSVLNEVIVDTTAQSIKLCTTTGSAGSAVWTAPSPSVPTGASNPGTCSVGSLFFNTTSSTLQVCTATNTWSNAGPQSFEDVYNTDADKTLTTSNGNFTVAAGSGTVTLNEGVLNATSAGAISMNAGATSTLATSAGNLNLSATAGNANITGGGASATAVNLNASNAAGGITGTWGTGGLNFSSTTGAFSITGNGNSTDGTTNGNLTLSTSGATGGNVALSTTGSGKTVTFQDANLSSPIKFNNNQTSLSAVYTGAGDTGILDALNALTTTGSATQGDNLVGVNNTFTNITGTTVQAALASIDGQIGDNAKKVDTLTFNPQYPNYVIYRSGSNNQGTLTDDYDNTNHNELYDWTSHQASLQNIDVKFRFPVPTDFKSLSGANSFTFNFRTGLNASTHNKLDFTVRDVTKSNTTCGSSTANASSSNNTWTSVAISAATLNTGCTAGTAIAAGDVLEADVTFYADNTASASADVGQTNLTYTN